MTESPTHFLHINGVDAPLLRQFGCQCGRCRAPERKANTSVSLISRSNGAISCHLLFDAGLGVVDSLIDSGLFDGPHAQLDGVVLTHWHPDHVYELNRLLTSYSLHRQRNGLPQLRLPLYCRRGTLSWLEREQGYLVATYLDPQITDENYPPGHTLLPLAIGQSDVAVTPVSVSHFSADRKADDLATAYACAAYVIETGNTKAVLLWDIDSENEWLVEPRTAEQAATVDLLSDADLLMVDTTFWAYPNRRTTHASFENVRRYAARLRPRETLLVHLSGHPDGKGNPGWGWTDEEWTAAATQQWEDDGLPGTVRVPAIGEMLQL